LSRNTRRRRRLLSGEERHRRARNHPTGRSCGGILSVVLDGRSVRRCVAHAVERHGLQGHPWPSHRLGAGPGALAGRSVGSCKATLSGSASLARLFIKRRSDPGAPALEPQDVRVSRSIGSREALASSAEWPATRIVHHLLQLTDNPRCGLHCSAHFSRTRSRSFTVTVSCRQGDARIMHGRVFRRPRPPAAGASACGRAAGMCICFAVGRSSVAWIRIMSPLDLTAE